MHGAQDQYPIALLGNRDRTASYPTSPPSSSHIKLFVLDSAFLTAPPTASRNDEINMTSDGVIRPVAHEFLCGLFNLIVRS
jgi:hypothetical protein